MGRRADRARDRGLDDEFAREALEIFESDDTEWGDPLPPERWPKGVGRPSLSGERAVSPKVTFRIDPALRDRAQQRADAEGTTISALARDALERYLAP